MRIIATVIAVLSLHASAFAQSAPNPVLEHFRAYRAAIAAGDMATAESEAAAALTASEQRDGNGGRTAVLALNLASLRLERGRRAEAIAPAQRANDIARAGTADAGVDPVLANLVLGRARLSNEIGPKDDLRAMLDTANARDDLRAEVYLGALDLARQELQDRRFAAAANAWDLVASTSDAAPGNATLARAQALALGGVSLIYLAEAMPNSRETRPEEIQAHDKLHGAMMIVRQRLLDLPAGAPTSTEARTYGMARAWHDALDSRLSDIDNPWDNEDEHAYQLHEQGASECVEIRLTPPPEYPRNASNNYEVGSVVTQFHMDPNGEVSRREVIGSAPNAGSFVDAVERVYDQWRVRTTDRPGRCQRVPIVTLVLNFRLP
ncbi:hypothetical protein U91I_04187 [alpha proteobacterium U9-1i]|nr:hypothetical protein U91I_04187 [alpha proteobacterium U9-1i]